MCFSFSFNFPPIFRQIISNFQNIILFGVVVFHLSDFVLVIFFRFNLKLLLVSIAKVELETVAFSLKFHADEEIFRIKLTSFVFFVFPPMRFVVIGMRDDFEQYSGNSLCEGRCGTS
jgi:hypothetical protein